TIAGLVLMISLTGRSYPAIRQILASPVVAVLMLLFILTNVVHMKIGIQVVIEDYIYEKKQKITLMMINTFFAWAIGLACAFSILRTWCGGGRRACERRGHPPRREWARLSDRGPYLRRRGGRRRRLRPARGGRLQRGRPAHRLHHQG